MSKDEKVVLAKRHLDFLYGLKLDAELKFKECRRMKAKPSGICKHCNHSGHDDYNIKSDIYAEQIDGYNAAIINFLQSVIE